MCFVCFSLSEVQTFQEQTKALFGNLMDEGQSVRPSAPVSESMFEICGMINDEQHQES